LLNAVSFAHSGAACGIAAVILSVQLVGTTLTWAISWLWTAIGPPPVTKPWPVGSATMLLSPLAHLAQSISTGFRDSSRAGHGVAGAWLVMALGGLSRPERSFIDRLVPALGAGWIAVMVAKLVDDLRYSCLHPESSPCIPTFRVEAFLAASLEQALV
jgi:hypothetical protein